MPTQEEVLQTVIESGSLPTLSTVASTLINITGREETTIYDITRLISQDVSLSTKILKVVNSSFYNFPNEVGTIQQAVAILGTNAVRSLVLSFSFLNMERPRYGAGFDYERFWEESLAAAVASKLIMAKVSDLDPEEAFTVSLLQNLGRLILACAYRETYDRLLTEAEGNEERLLALEKSGLVQIMPISAEKRPNAGSFPTVWRFLSVIIMIPPLIKGEMPTSKP